MKNLISVLISGIFLIFCSQVSFAAVSLSINPVDGSNTLRFREADGFTDRKEVRIRVNSTGGKRYQVFQRLNDPMVNEKGESLDMRAIQTASVGNSNGSGTLYLQSMDHLSMGDQLIYTSGQSGEGDSFVVAYGIDPDVFKGNGNFSGRLVFMVRVMGESSQDQSLVNITVESRSNLWKTAVSGGKNKALVRVKDTDTDQATADFVKISFSGNNGGDVKVTQEVDQVPQNTAGTEISPALLRFAVEGESAEGIAVTGVSTLSRVSSVIYHGRGDSNEILVRLFVDPSQVVHQDAGVYSGRLKYIVETDKGRDEFPVNVELSVQPVFTVDVALPPEGMAFDNILPNAPAAEKEVAVTVNTNLHRPYQVSQNLQTPMTNQKGEEIKKEYFTVKVELQAGGSGHTKFTDFLPMQTGEYPVFFSDAQGSPVTFKVIYRLQGYPGMSGGSFAAPIRFSLNQN